MAKLKVGDSFIFTLEMHAAKLKSACNGNCFSDGYDHVGLLCTIRGIERCSGTADGVYAFTCERECNKCHHVDTIDPYLPKSLTSSTLMSTLLEKGALIFKGEPEKTFRKMGITNCDDNLTPDGQTLFLSYLLRKNGADFKTEVVDKMVEEDKKDK